MQVAYDSMEEDQSKTHQQLVNELIEMRQRVAAAEAALEQAGHSTVSANRLSPDDLRPLLQSIQDAPTQDTVWRTLTKALQTVLSCTRSAVYQYDRETDTSTNPFARGLTRHLRSTLLELISDYPPLKPHQVHSPVIVNDIQQIENPSSLKTAFVEEVIGAYALFFISTADHWYTIALFCEKVMPFSDSEISLCQTIVELAGEVLYTQMQQNELAIARVREMRRNEMTRTLNNAPDLPTILQSISRLATDMINASGGLLGLVVDGQIMIFYPHNVPAHMNLRPALQGRGVAWQIVENGQSIVLKNYGKHPHAQPKWAEYGVRAFMGVPVMGKDECLGAIVVFDTKPDRQFTRSELALVESIGRQAGIAIQNGRMLSEAKQRAAALANALARQEELDELKTEFIQSVSHELRTPLGIIYGHAEMLESGDLGDLAPVQKDSVAIIVRRVRMLTDMVEDLTALMAAETQEFRRDYINPLDLINSMLAEYRMQAEDLGILLHSELGKSLPWLHGDITHMRRVFDNLFSNAFKYTPAGGSVTLHIFEENGKVVIELSDTGEGIDDKHLPRIFERFYQVTDKQNRPRRKGTGLGLALVKEIVEAHRGSVSVQSELGVGTTFRLELPGHRQPEAQKHN